MIFLPGQCKLNFAKASVVVLVRRGIGERVVIRSLLGGGLDCLGNAVGVEKGLASGLRGQLLHGRVFIHLGEVELLHLVLHDGDGHRGIGIRGRVAPCGVHL